MSGVVRTKVYRLNSDGLWDDKGTGSVSVEYLSVSVGGVEGGGGGGGGMRARPTQHARRAAPRAAVRPAHARG